MTSNCSIWLLCSLSTSCDFFSRFSILFWYSVIFASASSLIFLAFANSLDTCDSLSLVLFSASAIFLSFDKISFSCSDFNSKNRSLACKSLFLFSVSASAFASLKIELASFLAFLIRFETLLFSKNLAIANPIANPTTIPISILVNSIVRFCLIKKPTLGV